MTPPEPRSLRLAALRRRMAAADLPAFLVSRPENRLYLSGFQAEDPALTESSGHLLVTADRNFLLTDFRFQQEATEEAPGFVVAVNRTGLGDLLAGLREELKFSRLGFESDYLTVQAAERIRKGLGGLELVPTEDWVAEIRVVKDDGEISAIGRAQQVIEAVLAEILDKLEPGRTEQEVAWWVLEGLQARGAGPAFEPIVAAGPNGAKPHARPTGRPIREGEPVVMDVGARLDGYRSDLTRTFCLGRPDERFKRIYQVVRQAQKAALNGLRAGLTAREADGLGRSIIEAAGHGPQFGHSLGHGVGLATHEAPTLSPLRDVVLQANMVCTVEPGIYLPDWGGVRLEVMVVLEEHGCRVIGREDWFYEF